MAIHLHYTSSQIAFREQARAWLQANVPREPLQTLESEAGFSQHRGWERTLARGNWSMITWPRDYGGRGASLIEWLIFEEEYYRANAPARVNQNGLFLLGPTLMEFGTAGQRARFLPSMAAGEEIGHKPGPSRRRAPIWPRCAPRLIAMGITMFCAVTKSGHRERRSRTGVSVCSAPTRGRRVTKG